MSTITSPTSALNYGYDDSDTHTADSPTRGEQALWTAVITQALMDAATGSAKREAQKDKVHARSWLEICDDDFTDVCDLAGLDPSYVSLRARNALERNCRWRLPAGEGWRGRISAASRAVEAL